MNIRIIVACSAVLILGGCTYRVQAVSAPQLDVYSNYSQKVPGKWAISVDSDALSKEIHSEEFQCSFHSYPVDLRSAFRESAITTFQNLVQNLEVLNRPVPAEELAKNGFAGVIHIRGEDIRSHLKFDPGFWSSKADVRIELDVGLIVDGPNGRLVGTRATGKGDAIGDAGYYCGKTAEQVGTAAQAAIKDVLGVVGERFSNAPQLRPQQGATGPSTH